MDFGFSSIIHESAAIINNYDTIYNEDNFVELKYDLERFTTDESMYYDDHYQKDKNSWKEKPILQWNHTDVLEWIFSYICNQRTDFYRFQIEHYKHIADGTDLCNMTLDNFLTCDLEFGEYIYKGVQEYLENSNIFNILPTFQSIKSSTDSGYDSVTYPESEAQLSGSDENLSEDGLYDRPETIDDFEYTSNLPTVLPSSDDEDESVTNDSEEKLEMPLVSGSSETRRGRGRPRGTTSAMKKKPTPANSMGRLWEFIRNLLLNPTYCPSLIKWENYEEGVFRFVRTEKVAELWGSRKCNGKMTYEKLSRALRYYYRTKVFQPVLGRRLVYKFGPAAHGWQTENPNFEN